MNKLNIILLVILAALLFLGATYSTGRYQISASEKMYCWILDTASGEVKVVNYRDGKINLLDVYK